MANPREDVARAVSDASVVVGIEMGTVACGCCVALKEPGSERVEDAAMNNFAPGTSSEGPGVHKTLTAILLMADSEDVVAIGTRARILFAQSCDEGTQAEYLYFEHFMMGMSPHIRQVNPMLATIRATGANVDKPLMLPVSKYLGVVRQAAMDRLAALDEATRGDIPPALIGWVITVPAIWDDAAKMFMREAAVLGGIIDAVDAGHLVLALEPECAIISCMLSSVPPELRPLFVAGSRLMVVDCGSGNVKVTVSEVTAVDPIATRELVPPSGGPWGATTVACAFLQMLSDLMGVDAFNSLGSDMKKLLLDVWESTMRRVDIGAVTSEYVDLSTTLESLASTNAAFRDITERVRRNVPRVNEARGLLAPGDQIRLSRKRNCVLSPAVMRSLMDTAVEPMLAHVRRLLGTPQIRERPPAALILVGEFAESPYLQQRLQEEFGGLVRVVRTLRPDLAVVRGAAQLGMYPGTFRE